MIEDETPDHNSAKNQIFIKKKKWSWINYKRIFLKGKLKKTIKKAEKKGSK